MEPPLYGGGASGQMRKQEALRGMEPWELLEKTLLWEQLQFIKNCCVLDFGSGTGVTAAHFAKTNRVTAVEPDEGMIPLDVAGRNFKQLIGGVERLHDFADASFDAILCHNVLEYAGEREHILREFGRLLKKDGTLSIVKHNRYGRVMQMVVLLNQFNHAQELLRGKNSFAQAFGEIRYYEEEDFTSWCESFQIVKRYGLRTFWDLQQKQEIQREPEWQAQMLAMERAVAGNASFQKVAFFHHLLLQKEK